MTRWVPWVLVAGLSSCTHHAPGLQVPPAPPHKAEVVIEIPKRAGAPVVVLPLRLVRAPLVDKERARLERWVARHLAIQGQVALDVVPLEQVAALRKDALEKRIAADGPVCAAEPSLDEVLTRALPDAVRAQAVADCSAKRCQLTVSAARPGEAPLATWTAEVSKPEEFEDWEEAAQSLKATHVVVAQDASPAEPEAGRPENPIDFTGVRARGDWDDEPELEDLQPWSSAFAKCHERGVLPTGPDLLVLEIGRDGKVAACQAQSWRDPAEHDQLRCHCDAALQMTFEPGSADRRLAIEVRDTPELDALTQDGSRVIAKIEELQSTDPALSERALVGVRPWLALCYATTRLRAPVRFPVQFDISPAGEITSAHFAAERSVQILSTCIEGYLRYLPLPCTRSGQPATMQFVVHLQREEEAPEPVAQDDGVSPVRPSGSAVAGRAAPQ